MNVQASLRGRKLARNLIGLLLFTTVLLAGCKDVRDTPLPRELYGADINSVRDALKPDERALLDEFVDYAATLRLDQRDALKNKTYRDALKMMQEIVKKQESVAAQVRELIEEPSMQFVAMHTGPDGTVCGTFVEPRKRMFIALPNDEPLVTPLRPEEDDPKEYRSYLLESSRIQALRALHCWNRAEAAKVVASTEADIARLKPLEPPASVAALAPEDRVLLETYSGNNQMPTRAAGDAAVRVGAAADANALGVIVDLRSKALAQAYRTGFGQRSAGAVPPAIERVVLHGIPDDNLRESLVYLVSGHPECKFHYSDRELFDALREQLVAHQEEFVAKSLVCSTLADVDEPLAQTLRQLSKYEAAAPLIAYFKERRSAVAVPALIALQAKASLEPGEGFSLYAGINDALLTTRTDAAIDAVKRRIQWLIEHRAEPNVDRAAWSLMITLSRSMPDSRLRYLDIKPLAKAFTGKDMQKVYVEWVRRWRVSEAVPDLFDLLDSESAVIAADAILDIGTPDDWSKLDRRIGSDAHGESWVAAQGKAVRDHVRFAAANPERELKERTDRQNRELFSEVQARFSDERMAAMGLKDKDPVRYVAVEKDRLERSAKLAQEYQNSNRDVRFLNRGIVEGYRGLGGYFRFTLHDPQSAVDAYRRALTFPLDPADRGEDTRLLLRIALADTLRFDLNDPQGAITQYREALATLAEAGQQPAKNPNAAGLQSASAPWLKAEIAYLSGGTQAARPNQQDCAVLWFVMQFGAFSAEDPDLQQIVRLTQVPAAERNRTELARRLWALSPTPAHMVPTVELWPMLGSVDSVVSFLRKHDPSGFLTRCMLQSVEAMPRPPEATGAVTQGKREGGQRSWSGGDIAMMQDVAARMLGPPPPAVAEELRRAQEMRPKLADPEKTWRTFLGALRSADLPVAWRCLTPQMRSKFEPLFSQMTADQLRKMADSFTGFQVTTNSDDFREAIVKRSSGRVGFVYFVNMDGEWRIEEM